MSPPVYGSTSRGDIVARTILDADEIAQANLILLGDKQNPVYHPKRKGYVACRFLDAPLKVGNVLRIRDDGIPIHEAYEFVVVYSPRGGLK